MQRSLSHLLVRSTGSSLSLSSSSLGALGFRAADTLSVSLTLSLPRPVSLPPTNSRKRSKGDRVMRALAATSARDDSQAGLHYLGCMGVIASLVR